MSTPLPGRQQPPAVLFQSTAVEITRAAAPSSSAARKEPPARNAAMTFENVVGRVGVLVYFILLIALALVPAIRPSMPIPDFALRELRSPEGIAPWIAFAVGTVALGVGRFAPLGFLAVLALPARRRWAQRLLFVTLPSLVIASAMTAVALYGEHGTAASLSELIAALLFCGLGVWLGSGWLRGWPARLLILPKLAAGTLVVAFAIGFNLYISLEAIPFETDATPVTADTTRRVYRMFRGKSPRDLKPGETATLRLSDKEINEVLSWSAMSMAGNGVRARVELSDGSPYLLLSAVSPIVRGPAKYFNVIVGGGVQVTDGALDLDIRRVRLGSLEVPRFLLSSVSPQIEAMINRNAQLAVFLGPVRNLTVRAHDVSATYGHAELPPGAIAALFEGEALEDLRVAILAHTAHLLASEARDAPADRRVVASLESAFAYARERSADGSPRLENQAALLALGVILGHPRLEQLVGSVMDATEQRTARAFQGATLWQRADWTKHFFVSAAISVLSTRGLGDGIGIFKEQLDADGGTGFSFGDLLADRAGTTLAVLATRDDESARMLQERLSGPLAVADVMPAGADLPENMQESEFKATFGSIGSPAYQRVTNDIERRIAACRAYRSGASS